MSVPTEWIISLQGIRSGPWWTFKLTVNSVHWVDYTGMNNPMFHPPHTWTEEHNNTVWDQTFINRESVVRGERVCVNQTWVCRGHPLLGEHLAHFMVSTHVTASCCSRWGEVTLQFVPCVKSSCAPNFTAAERKRWSCCHRSPHQHNVLIRAAAGNRRHQCWCSGHSTRHQWAILVSAVCSSSWLTLILAAPLESFNLKMREEPAFLFYFLLSLQKMGTPSNPHHKLPNCHHCSAWCTSSLPLSLLLSLCFLPVDFERRLYFHIFCSLSHLFSHLDWYTLSSLLLDLDTTTPSFTSHFASILLAC